MITRLQPVSPKVEGERTIYSVEYEVQNFYEHQVLVHISNLMTGLITSKSNNSTATVAPRDVRNFWTAWGAIRAEWENAKKYRDNPSGTNIETGRFVQIPHENEIAQIPNLKIQRVCYELSNCTAAILGQDSITQERFIDDMEISDIELSFSAVADVALQYLGDGKSTAEGKGWNTGIAMPRYNYGELVPSADTDSVKLREASSEKPVSGLPDAASKPSTAPNPS